MTIDNFYWYASVLIFVPWLLLILVPRYRWTERIAFGAALILIAAGAWFTLSHLISGAEGGSFASLQGLSNLFRSTQMLLAGWFNYLAFGLLTGIWQVFDGRQNKIPHLLIVPSLLLTLLAGPLGLFPYLVLRYMKTRKWLV
jgi:Domain of unknown function (DUF4281)